jgi:hypothetical protein
MSTMSEFEKAQLALMKEQIEATRENTAKLALLAPPDPQKVIKSQDDLLEVMRRGGPPKRIGERRCLVRAIDGGKLGSGELIGEIPCLARIVYDDKSPGGRVFELQDETAIAIAFYGELFDAEHTEQFREAKTVAAREALADARERSVNVNLYQRFRVPLYRGIIGKDVSRIGHLVTWLDDPASVADVAEAAAQ